MTHHRQAGKLAALDIETKERFELWNSEEGTQTPMEMG